MTDWSERRAAWDTRYETDEYRWGFEPNEFVVRNAGALPPGTALDLGCGRGGNAIWLAKRRHRVTGVDWSQAAIAQARSIASEQGVEVEFVVADLLAWRPTDRYDLVLLSYVQLPPAERPRVHARAVEALAPGGTVLLVAHHLDNLEHGVGGPQTPEVLYTEEQLGEDFASLVIDLNDKVLRHVDREDAVGDAIDAALIARKITT
ncbi:MAG TPA: methyltransferase domain-containing protein [Acidimicrobiia bacterium]|jgi:SAM-dependent methyltransferase